VIQEGADDDAVGATHRFVSQREVAKMATIVPTIHPDGTLTVNAPGMEPLAIDPNAPLSDEVFTAPAHCAFCCCCCCCVAAAAAAHAAAVVGHHFVINPSASARLQSIR
jgi:hypothetical protein